MHFLKLLSLQSRRLPWVFVHKRKVCNCRILSLQIASHWKSVMWTFSIHVNILIPTYLFFIGWANQTNPFKVKGSSLALAILPSLLSTTAPKTASTDPQNQYANTCHTHFKGLNTVSETKCMVITLFSYHINDDELKLAKMKETLVTWA